MILSRNFPGYSRECGKDFLKEYSEGYLVPDEHDVIGFGIRDVEFRLEFISDVDGMHLGDPGYDACAQA